MKSHAYRFLGGCLIATEDPMTFAQETFANWIDGLPSVKKLLDRYQKDKELLQQKKDEIE